MPEQIKVLIVDDNDDTRDGTRRLLEYEDNIEIVGFADNGQSAVDQASELKPSVILMDINMPVMDGLTATELIKSSHPEIQIIVVSVQDDAHYMRQAFQKGAFDFIAKPITSAELAHAIERANQEHTRASMQQAMQPPQQVQQTSRQDDHRIVASRPDLNGQVIAVMGLKGGVGKTTIAVSLGVGLARLMPDQKVLIVDSNLLFGDLAVFLSTRSDYNILNVIEMASDPEGIDIQTAESVFVPHESGAKLLLAPANPGEAQPVSAEQFVQTLNQLRRDFHYIIVDTATTFDPISVAVIRTADRMVVVATPTMPALKDARLLFNELTGAEFPSEHILLVLNEVDKSSRITREQISNFLKHEVVAEIPDDPFAIEAVNNGRPLIAMDSKRSVAVRPLMNLVQLVRDSVSDSGTSDEHLVEEQRRGGIFGSILGG